MDRAFQKKTNELVQKHIGAEQLVNVAEFVRIDENTIDLIKSRTERCKAILDILAQFVMKHGLNLPETQSAEPLKAMRMRGAGWSYGS